MRRGGGPGISPIPASVSLAAALFAASLVITPPASAQDVTIWSADLEVKTLNTAQDEFGCAHDGPFNGQCANSNVLTDNDFKLHGTTYTIRRIEDDGSKLDLTLNALLPLNVLEFLTLKVDDDTDLAFENASISSSNKRYRWNSSPSWSSGDDVDLSITDASGPSLVKNTSLSGNDRNLFENGHRSAQAFTAGTWARVTSIGIGIGDEVDDDVEVTLHKGGGSNPGDRLKRLENPLSITADSVNVFTVPDGGIVLERSKTYFVQVKTTSSNRVAVSVTIPQSEGNEEDAGGAKNWTINNDSWTNRPSIGAWQESNQSMRIDIKGKVLLATPGNVTARVVAPMRVTLEWDRTLPSLTGTIDRDDGYRIQWSPDGSTSWTSLVNDTNQHGTFDIWCVCYPTRYNDDTITPGTTRHYRIKAVDDDEESAWSEVVSATTPGLVDSEGLVGSDGGQIEFGAVASDLDALNDQKVFRVELKASEQYRFMIRGAQPKHRVVVTDPGGTEIENFVLELGNTLRPRITAQSSGEHQVKISHGGGFSTWSGGLNAGWFQFQLVPVSDPAVGTLRLPTPSALRAVLNTYGDVDRAEIAVQPGKAYAVRVQGRETASGTAATPWIQRANPPGIYTDHNMGKPWVDGVTATETSNSICAEPGDNEAKCEEFQAFVIDLRGLTGADQTFQIYVAPTARPGTRPYRVGTYRVELKELLPSQLQGVRMPLRARFASQPARHDGSKGIKVRVGFSDALDGSPEHGVEVEGGEVTSVRAVDSNAPAGVKGGRAISFEGVGRKPARSTQAQPAARAAGAAEGPEQVWEFEIEPDSHGDVTVSLEAWRPCEDEDAICTADGRVLSQGVSTTVRGPGGGPAPNTPAAGAPTISGTPQVGEELTASASGISDADGLDDASFAYQWIRTDTDIQGATGSAYTAVDADEGKTLKVRVGFTDDAGNAESLTSAATDVVAAAPAPLTARFEKVPAAHDGETAFRFRVAFSEPIVISFRALREDAFTVTGGRVTGVGRVDGRKDLFGISVEPDSDAEMTITLPAGRDCAVSGAICGRGENPRQLANTPTATVAGPAAEPLTASFEGMPEAHDGESAFTFRVAFSEDIGISYRSLREVTGGAVRTRSR